MAIINPTNASESANAETDGVGEDSAVPIEYADASVEESHGKRGEHEVKEPVRQWLVGFCSFDGEGGCNPERNENHPAAKQKFAGCIHVALICKRGRSEK
jgi:hypothetical protein